MRENLDDSLELMFGHEGGYSNRKTDRGGPTKYGITHKTLAAHRGVASVTAEQVKAMHIDEAEAIYRKSYWGPAGGDVLPAGLDYAVFDSGVTSGPLTAVMLLQDVLRAAGVYDGARDGWIGEQTLRGVASYPGGLLQLIRAYCDRRLEYMRGIKGKQGWAANGRGWTIRVTGKDPAGQWKEQPGVVGNAVALAQRQRPAPTPLPLEVQAAAKAKAEPKVIGMAGALLKPEVALPAVAGVATPASALILGSGPIQWAVAIGIGAVVLIGSVYALRRILRNA